MERQDNDWIVEIKDMSFSYAEGSRVILDDVSLSFRKGEVIAIMGGSGMGKTTLLKLIGGLLTPDKGEVFISILCTAFAERWECCFSSEHCLRI